MMVQLFAATGVPARARAWVLWGPPSLQAVVFLVLTLVSCQSSLLRRFCVRVIDHSRQR